MKNSTISKPWSYLIDLVSTDAVKSRRRSTLVDVVHVVASAYQHGGADKLRHVCNVYSLSR